MSINKQLFANNAKSTLLGTLNSGDMSLTLAAGTGTLYPSGITSGQYFLITVEAGGVLEIIKCSGRAGDVITISARAQEGTSAATFPVGSVVEMRVTRDTLSTMAKSRERLFELNSLDLLDPPILSDGNSYILHTNDDNGFPIYSFRITDNKWSFPSHASIKISGVATTGTNSTTILTSTSISTLFEASPTSGKYILQMLTLGGVSAGQARIITATTSNQITVSPAFGSSIALGDSFEVYQSNSSILNAAATVGDEALVNSIIFGES